MNIFEKIDHRFADGTGGVPRERAWISAAEWTEIRTILQFEMEKIPQVSAVNFTVLDQRVASAADHAGRMSPQWVGVQGFTDAQLGDILGSPVALDCLRQTWKAQLFMTLYGANVLGPDQLKRMSRNGLPR